MKEVAEGVYFIHGMDEMLPDSHVYIIGKPESKDLSMVDAGLMGKGGYKIRSIKNLGIFFEDIKRIIMTHTHLDHIGCLSELREKMPWVELWVHTAEAAFLENGDDRTVYGMDMFKDMFQSQFKLDSDAFKFIVDRKLEGGEKLEIGKMTWEVIHVPGHSAGSIALYDRKNKILIPGDVVYADYSIGRFDLYSADPMEHRNSLMRLAELEVNILLPGHNRILEHVQAGYIRETAEQWGPYLS
jgi:hydroxyacylglutathione hydrolase